ncbi:MAG: hypothetical protein K1X64_12970 [Myxococcaceae bacterium]|nr:hypothetical protein [Myxococcaceae bacterium]
MRIFLAMALALTGCTGNKATHVTQTQADNCAGVPVLTLEQLKRGEGQEQRIAVDGVPTPLTMCTRMLCPDGTGCCNKCKGGYVLHNDSDYRLSLTALPGCTGTSCDLQCVPFAAKATQTYRFVGVHHHTVANNDTRFAASEIAVETYCPAENR